MPTILRIKAYRLFFVSLDQGEPPHIHVRREKKVAKIWLNPVALARPGRFRPSEIKTIVKLVQQHRDFLLEKWHEYFDH